MRMLMIYIYNKVLSTRTRSGLPKLLLLMLLFVPVMSQAQIDIKGKVYGGARQANVGGSSFVNIGADNHDVIINAVYGGNDISGTIGTGESIPTALEEAAANHIDNTYSAFIRISPEKTTTTGEGTSAVTTQDYHIFIGNLFGGSNGDYIYSDSKATEGDYKDKYTASEIVKDPDGKTVKDINGDPVTKVVASSTIKYVKPELSKVYLEIKGGTIAYVYGGGNNATVTSATDICINNNSQVTTKIPSTASAADNSDNLLLKDNAQRLKDMGIPIIENVVLRDKFHFSRVFGGNNKAEMKIIPSWHLEKGAIENLYSGGNAGNMTSPNGLLLEIVADSHIMVENVFGGCRKADVHPMDDMGNDVTPTNAGLNRYLGYETQENYQYHFPDKLPARVVIRGGTITNVYGGNDISGKVYGGNAIGIYNTIYGNVYGGGNGSYPYTDKTEYEEDPYYGDFYYNPGSNSVEALNNFRPNAEQVSIRLGGTAAKKTVIHGSVYVGGNSATLKTTMESPMVDLKFGSYVIADNVFLGNNGENMVTSSLLNELKTVNSMDLTDESTFAKYMNGCAMSLMPKVKFDGDDPNDVDTYQDYTTMIGSLFCGGNVGSMTVPGKTTITFNRKLIVFDKVVGGCNNANVDKVEGVNAAYYGGLIGSDEDGLGTDGLFTDGNGNIKDRLELNFEGLKIQPKRWKVDTHGDYVLEDGERVLEWNIVSADTGQPIANITPNDPDEVTSTDDDHDRRLFGGNVYGGCYNTGHVNGNVIINLKASLMDRVGKDAIFDSIEINEGEALLYGNENYVIKKRRTGVILDMQGMDPLGKALNVFGGGFGEGSEIWGSTTINLQKGYTFQIFGGGEKGAIGKKGTDGKYAYDPRFSTHVNLCGDKEGVYRGYQDANDDTKSDDPTMAEAEFIYGGSFFAPIAGNTIINLCNGRIFTSFAGSCMAEILGHTETYIGRNSDNDTDLGFPWVRDHIYCGNDLGGKIEDKNPKSFLSRVSSDIQDKVYDTEALKASAYVEYLQGRVDYIFGGCYGYYNYKESHYNEFFTDAGIARDGYIKPRLDNAFVNFKPTSNPRNAVSKIYGAGQGYSGDSDRDIMQNRSYILIDIPQTLTAFQNMDVFGAGDYSGVGMGVEKTLLVDHKVEGNTVDGQPNKASAIIDLMRGRINSVYGASYKEGVTRRTVVNVPSVSTIQLNNIFAGAFGIDNTHPCDVYEGIVNYNSETAIVTGALYGGNNSYRRTLYGTVNVSSPVYANAAQTKRAKVYGAGLGKDTWSQYTEINLHTGASVQEVYGGGNAGRVLCKESVEQWHAQNTGIPIDLGNGYEDTGLNNPIVHGNELHKWDSSKPEKYNTNVHIYKNAEVHDQPRDGRSGTDGGYAFAGGEGTDADVSGTTYIECLGGKVWKDLYAAGYGGSVMDLYGSDGNTSNLASATAYVEGGKVRKVYGGGYQGHVGKHVIPNNIDSKYANRPVAGSNTSDDIQANSYVVIGIREDQSNVPDDYGYYHGVPTIEFNAYGGGEGGSVFGTAHLTINNGYIGYYYDGIKTKTVKVKNEQTDEEEEVEVTYEDFQEKLNDETQADGIGKDRLKDCGNAFGGGYDDLSTCDFTNTTVWGGNIRNCLFGGGEIATVGRGATKQSTGAQREKDIIWKHGGTNIEMYNGHVHRNVFGGGKGYNELKYGEGNKLYTDGYVFGQTEVHIHGGEIGTAAGVADGYGNVFGGGDIGYVYGKGEKSTDYTGSPGHYYYYDGTGKLTEDCKVVIAPYLQKKSAGTLTIGSRDYNQWDYVKTDDLNTILATKDSNGNWTGTWLNDLFTGDADNEPERGVTIHNAVFAGGNVASGSEEQYANAPTVFGNTTATLYDVYYRDFITVGTEKIGGLYGGGNLSVVDGYRELNITNYGTDYYGLDDKITIEKYQKLSSRERAYFQLQYECLQECTINGKTYKVGDKVSEEDYNKFTEYNSDQYWKQYGFCSIYAGRLLNTIQRADLCGVYGSRMVLQGAKDRVTDKADNTLYTINRIGELSLNKQNTIANDNSDQAVHGNYFGIYSVVNCLGHLTSDVRLDDNRKYIETVKVSEEGEEEKYEETTQVSDLSYWEWKIDPTTAKKERNKGTCHNLVALASGVFLELTTEESTANNKVYGDITGIVELDLINVRKELSMGGGYVYARNEHGVRTEHQEYTNVILSPYNKGKTVNNKQMNIEARTYKRYTYATADADKGEFETSGNFIHRSKRIIDDCYPKNGSYKKVGNEDPSPAHYWYIKGDVYVYDQNVSAYVGTASAYSKEVKIPLTITAGSNGQLKLLNVQPSKYAYFAPDRDNPLRALTEADKITADGVKLDQERTTYYLNDVVSWWDWQLLTNEERKAFVKETYVNADTCYVDGVFYPTGTYVLEHDPSIHNGNAAQTAYSLFKADAENHTFADKNNQPYLNKDGTDMSKDAIVAKVFHSSNNISHENGYVVTFDMDTPGDWNDWYTLTDDNDEGKEIGDYTLKKKINKAEYDGLDPELKKKYTEGPTFRLKSGETAALYGQKDYEVGDIISKEVHDDYEKSVLNVTLPSGQAIVDLAYIGKKETSVEGNVVPEAQKTDDYEKALLCTSSLELGKEEFILQGEVVAESALDAMATKYMNYHNAQTNAVVMTLAEAKNEVSGHFDGAYYCSTAGKYGGQHFKHNQNYTAIKSWCSLTDDRSKFNFNYDAFDLLIDPNYTGVTSLYHSPYSDVKSVEYEAVYTGSGTLEYTKEDNTTGSVQSGHSITREEFESLKNEQRHYTRVNIPVATNEDSSDHTVYVYIVNYNFYDKGTPYAKGQDLSLDEYNALDTENQSKVTHVQTTNDSDAAVVMYYCYESYSGGNAGTFISPDTYNSKTNYQKDFTIRGVEPTETTMLYVSRESVIKDVTQEKIISVVYQYTYYDDDTDGEGVSLVNELHVVNIHLNLESGVPEIGPLNPPATVLPGNPVKLTKPEVIPGLYEVLISGWEMYTDPNDAENHRNGETFLNNSTPVYWYQNQKLWVAFYTRTYLGLTYSNPVEISVANYHDLGAVMADANHLYVDHPGVDRESKIYIDNRDLKREDGKSELDLLKDFFDLSVFEDEDPSIVNSEGIIQSGKFKDHHTLNNHVRAGRNLEFFLSSDVSPKAYTTWTPIGGNNITDDPTTANVDEAITNNGQCFDGVLHGDGHTISGLSNSLFAHLCGDVYNLGVTGTFQGAGIADEGYGYLENCWVKSTAESVNDVKAVFGNPKREEGDPRGTIQVVNCYYQEEDNATTPYSNATDDLHGTAIRKPMQSFYNGEVAYNLNGFYLNRRYYDGIGQSSGELFKYLPVQTDGSLPTEMSPIYYPAETDETWNAKWGDLGYVERRYENEDFIYASGRIPEGINSRLRIEEKELSNGEKEMVTRYVPIYPDDYIFFGQMLTYDYDAAHPHQSLPSSVKKAGDRLVTDDNGNRVFRAPAYFGTKEKDAAHFNSMAYLAAYSNPTSITSNDGKPAYPGMTAIDFKGHNDTEKAQGLSGKLFYQPVLDEPGLFGIANKGETPNLLVYAPAEADNQNTYKVLNDYFIDEPYSKYTESGDLFTDGKTYGRVAVANSGNIVGHLVKSNLKATTDHLLVDRQDFNCPIGYSFDTNYRMWYQRRPDNFAGQKKDGTIDKASGWEGVSLPFEATTIATHEKGEITHFYQGSPTGHEYWLRQFRGASAPTSEGVVTASFTAPDAVNGNSKTDGNQFLWEYYYSKANQWDENTDEYHTYYNSARTYNGYPYQQAGVPYLIGFPGKRYYEFDLSRVFEPQNEYEQIERLNAVQVITFVADASTEDKPLRIAVSDDENKSSTFNGYTFTTNYLSRTFDPGTAKTYILNNDGSSYDAVPAASTDPEVTITAVKVPAFRPYFTKSSGAREVTRSIIFSDEQTQLESKDDHDLRGEDAYSLSIYAKRKKIVVESNLREITEVRIVNTAGITINTFDIEPGETVTTRVNNSGVYIVQTTDGHYTKKLAVR